MKKLLFSLLLVAFCALPAAYADSARSPEIDATLTAQAPWKVGEIIPNSEKSAYIAGKVTIHCQFLGVVSNNRYLVQEFNKNGLKSTEPFTVDVNDELIKSGSICSDQKMEGVFTRYRPGGERFYQLTYENGIEQGRYIQWSKRGHIVEEGYYQNNKKQGEWIGWHDEKQKSSVETYNAGEKDGSWLEWYENGQKKSEAFYKAGEPDGLWQGWHENGKKGFEILYTNGKENGLWQRWNRSGNLIESGRYVNGMKEGDWREVQLLYYEKGRYQAELREGVWKGWSIENDSLVYEGSYKKGLRDGKWTDWNDLGVSSSGVYRQDNKVGVWIHKDNSGRIFEKKDYGAGNKEQ